MHYAELIERLRASVNGPAAFGGTALVNPDGPEAATALEAQAARIAELEGALRQIVGHCDNSGYGNPIVNERIVDRCDETARQALTKGTDHEG